MRPKCVTIQIKWSYWYSMLSRGKAGFKYIARKKNPSFNELTCRLFVIKFMILNSTQTIIRNVYKQLAERKRVYLLLQQFRAVQTWSNFLCFFSSALTAALSFSKLSCTSSTCLTSGIVLQTFLSVVS